MNPTSRQPKRKRKIIILVTVLVLIVVFVFPGFIIIDFGGISDNMKINNALTTLLSAIEKKDGDKIKNLFSEGVINEVGDEALDRGVEYIFEVFQGKVLSKKEFNTSRGRTKEDYKKRRIIETSYIVTTDIDVYRIWFVYHTINTITPGFQGMYQLIVQKETDKEYGYLRDDFMGIYVPRFIEESEKNIPHYFQTEFGNFTLPAGFYKDDSLSDGDKLYFSVGEVDLGVVGYDFFTISFGETDYGINDIEAFRDTKYKELNDLYSEYPNKIYYDGIIIEIHDVSETEQDHPLQIFSVTRGGYLLEKYYYIIGENKYTLVFYSQTPPYQNPELEEKQKSMMAAVESLVNSFVWAD